MPDPDAIRWLCLSADDRARLRAAVAAALADHPEVVTAYHFGSSVRGGPARDIDIALVVDRSAQRSFDPVRIAGRIADLCARPVADFDVRVVNGADPVFLGNLMRDGQRCYERDTDSRVAFEVCAMNAWLDFRPAWDRMRARVLAGWSRG